ncbi:hypothetical protein D3C87_1757170 [compost metagenome]
MQQRTEHPVQIAVRAGALGAGVGHVLDVATRAKMPTGTADDQRPNCAVIVNCRQYCAQFAHHLQAHGIAAVRAIEGDVQHAVVQFQQQRLAIG